MRERRKVCIRVNDDEEKSNIYDDEVGFFSERKKQNKNDVLLLTFLLNLSHSFS